MWSSFTRLDTSTTHQQQIDSAIGIQERHINNKTHLPLFPLLEVSVWTTGLLRYSGRWYLRHLLNGSLSSMSSIESLTALRGRYSFEFCTALEPANGRPQTTNMHYTSRERNTVPDALLPRGNFLGNPHNHVRLLEVGVTLLHWILCIPPLKCFNLQTLPYVIQKLLCWQVAYITFTSHHVFQMGSWAIVHQIRLIVKAY